MTTGTAQVVETPVTVNDNSPIQDYVHPDDQTQPTFEMTNSYRIVQNAWTLSVFRIKQRSGKIASTL